LSFYTLKMSIDSQVLVTLNEIEHFYWTKKVLGPIHLQIKNHGLHAIIGANGSGKTTLLKIIAGLLTPSLGEVSYAKAAKMKVSFVSHKILPDPHLSVHEFLTYQAMLHQIEPALYTSSIDEVCEKLGLTEVKHQLIATLSQGYSQRLLLAMALLSRPELIILDEPTVGLDPLVAKSFLDLISELKKDHLILMSGHHLDEIEKVADDVTILLDGKVAFNNSLSEALRLSQEAQCLYLKTNANQDKLQELANSFEINEAHEDQSYLLRPIQKMTMDEASHQLADFLIKADLKVHAIYPYQTTLEDIFKKVHKQ